MLNSGGDGGLKTTIKFKEYTKVDMDDIDTMADARLVAKAFKDNRNYQRSITKANAPMPPELETNITKTKDGKFIVWYRDRI